MLQSPDKIAWSHFSHYSESEDDFILYYAEMIDTILPKQRLTTVTALRGILAANLRRWWSQCLPDRCLAEGLSRPLLTPDDEM